MHWRPQPIQVDLAVARDQVAARHPGRGGGKRGCVQVYTLHAPLRGQLQRITAESGRRRQGGGDPAGAIEPAPPAFLGRQDRAEAAGRVEGGARGPQPRAAELNKAKADLTFARGRARPRPQLIERRTISQRTLEDAERSYNVAQANLATAEAA